MSGAEFTRKKYDDYNTRLRQSTSQLNYSLYPGKANNCDTRFIQNPGHISGQGVSVSASRSLVDVESDLRNIPRKASDNPQLQYVPVMQREPLVHLQEVTEKLDENSRILNPASNNRGIPVFEKHVLLRPEEQGLVSSYRKATNSAGKINVDTKNFYKDNYTPDIQFPLNYNSFFGENVQVIFEEKRDYDPCVKINSENICGNFTKPLNDMVFTPDFCQGPLYK